MEENPVFKKVNIQGWRQFREVNLDIHPRLTVLTGSNGAGKSTLLSMFSKHFGFNKQLLATPKHVSGGGYSYVTGIFETIFSKLPFSRENKNEVGSIVYSNEAVAQITIPEQAGVQYNFKINGQQTVNGIFIDSHQPIPRFQSVGQIPTSVLSSTTAYNNYNNEFQQIYQGGHTGYSPIYRIKEALISMAMFGEGNSKVAPNPEVKIAYEGFIKILRKTLPVELGFTDIDIRPPEVVMITNSGEFLIDACSGGVMALIDLSWRIYMFSLANNSFVVVMDEPENHLHPTMQRTLLKTLIDTFPSAQFIVATHSPFIVSSVRDSNVYVLKHIKTESDQANDKFSLSIPKMNVISLYLDTVNKAGNASEILRDVLGVSVTLPEWVEEDLQEIVSRYHDLEITRERLVELRSELKERGLEELYPSALAGVVGDK